MSDIAIRVENLSKRYEIGRAGTRHDTLRDALAGLFRREGRGRSETFWALRDVSFEVKRGEVVGIIGRNGAGKSTLLKVLSQITEPTGGRAEIHGRVGSLLEVGTGFHPELTGRENIYLNGAILGMRREEIARKFDEIVAFSEIEKFLDTPVKRYSSGMYVRLAFAVAAHLEPEILLVDEVLAVGDAAFQKKALGKMGDVVNEGRTVLFVSHNMDAVQRLCNRALLVANGRIITQGDVKTSIREYQREQLTVRNAFAWHDISQAQRTGSGDVKFSAVKLCGGSLPVDAIFTGGPLSVELDIVSKISTSVSSMAITVFTPNGTMLVNADTISQGKTFNLREGRTRVQFVVYALHLSPGTYNLGLWLANHPGIIHDRVPTAIQFEVVEYGQNNQPGVRVDGLVPCSFKVEALDFVPDGDE
ncbi:MAG TPA: ABC transporter ATP-binding protein [Promineifilum sp.]|nr:ABC transporter ATP-binding protein [Promineifilum sp.]HRO89342.1 ABC transporter ATP-binding protein [Promineifilum sp.]HRQ11829.1 ABC transporter ATP-binding protein [Promineifilum sp.]